MIYGLYLSATGVMANSHRQDVIASNLANVETVGFRRDVTSFQQRLSEAEAQRRFRNTNPILDDIGGGLLLAPTSIDRTQAEFEETGNNLDLAVQGRGFFAVRGGDGKTNRLTRDGRFMVDRDGFVVMANDNLNRLLDVNSRPIQVDPTQTGTISIGEYGELTQDGTPVAQIGLFDPADPDKLAKVGGNLLKYDGDARGLRAAPARMRSGFVERSNVDPTTELAALMDAQRQLEANANMIRYQDATLSRLVNDVGRIT